MQVAQLPQHFTLEEAERKIQLMEKSSWWEIEHLLQSLVNRSLIRMTTLQEYPYRALCLSDFVCAFALEKGQERPDIFARLTTDEVEKESLPKLRVVNR